MNNWKTAFFVSLTFSFIIITISAYIVFVNTITSGHCRDNEFMVKEDLEKISVAISNGANSIQDFESELRKINASYSIEQESDFIRLQLVNLRFDESGKFLKIETY